MNNGMLGAGGKGALQSNEEKKPGQEKERDGEGGSEKKQVWRVAAARDGPAEAVNDAGHRVKAVKPAPTRGHERRRVRNGRSEHPELDEKRHDIADVARKGIERGERKAHGAK